MALRMVLSYLDMINRKNDGLKPAKLHLTMIVQGGLIVRGIYGRYDAPNAFVELELEDEVLPIYVSTDAIISIHGTAIESINDLS